MSDTGTFFWARTDRGEQEVESFRGSLLRIGRGTNAELRFPERSIDLEHAAIAFEDGSYLLRDLRSSTGVWVNGERVRSVRLRDQDAIELGGYRLKVKWQLATDPLFLQIEPLAFDPEMSTVIHTFKASSQALVVLAELEAQRLEREPSELSTFIDRILPDLDLPAGNTALLTRRLPVTPRPVSEGFTELLTAQREPPPPLGKAPSANPAGHAGAPPLVPRGLPDLPPPLPNLPPAMPPAGPPPAQPSLAKFPPAAPAPPWAPASSSAAATTAPSKAPATPKSATAKSGPGNDRIDYAAAYLLPLLTAKVGVGIVSFVAVGLFFAQLFAAQGGQMFAPGPLARPHQTTIKACRDCHSGFRPVSDLSCRSSCHTGIGDHQTAGLALETGKMACTDCHTEHRGEEALALVATNVCTSCHGRLAEQLPASVFANRVTDFVGDHPEFAIDTPSGRRRLSEPGGRQTDPGGLIGFSHVWHLTRLPAKARRVCADCHRRDPKTDEILPLDFSASCQSCHSLPFDPRFPGTQVPHAKPVEVYNFLTGTYLRNPQILANLGDAERQVASPSLSREQQLAKVAQLVGDRLLRNNCAKCHRFESVGGGGRGDLAQVAPVHWRSPYFLHASFQHGPHLKIAECRECHAEAASSDKAADLLLPGIAACQTCHRPAASAKVDKSKIGEAHCLNCHSYHPTPAERLASRDSSQEAKNAP